MNRNIKVLLDKWKALEPQRNELKERIWQKFMLEFNYNSNHIEGNTLTYGQTELLLLFGKVVGDASMKDLEEMKAHNVGLKMVVEQAKLVSEPLTETFIRQVHKILLREDYTEYRQLPSGRTTSYKVHAGCYKTRPNSVITRTGERFEYASVHETPALMHDLVKWYNDEAARNVLSPIELAALFHYRYIRIHPFEDGNGRIARLMVNFILCRYGYPMIVVPSKTKEKYLTALNKCDIEVGSEPSLGAHAELEQITPFLEYLEKLLAAEMRNDITIIEGGTIHQWWYNGEIVRISNENTLKVLNAIAKDPKISVRGISIHIGINPSAVQRHMDALKNKGYIVRIGGTRGEWHIAMTRL